MRQIFPPSLADEPVSLNDVYRTVPRSRPWIVLSMVQSIDGSTSLDGVSGPLGSSEDQRIFSVLRSRADLLLVGSSTVKAEGYKPLTRPGQRLAIVTGSGDLPWTEPVYTHNQTVIVAPEDGPAMPATVVRAGTGRVDLAKALQLLAPKVVLLEGGSSLNGQMLQLGLVDELCITTAPVTVTGKGPRIAHSEMESQHSFALATILESDGYLFSRYLAVRP